MVLIIISVISIILSATLFGTGILDDARKYNFLEHLRCKGKLPMSYTRFKRYEQYLATCNDDYWFIDNDRDIINQGYQCCHPSDLETLAYHFDVCLGKEPYEELDD